MIQSFKVFDSRSGVVADKSTSDYRYILFVPSESFSKTPSGRSVFCGHSLFELFESLGDYRHFFDREVILVDQKNGAVSLELFDLLFADYIPELLDLD